jgi:hypothetical protein
VCIENQLQNGNPKRPKLDHLNVDKSKREATRYENGKLNLSAATARRRRMETYEAASVIHGAGVDCKRPAEVGLADATINKCSDSVLTEVFSNCPKITKKVIPKMYKPILHEYESSEDNMIRSISVYYTGGVMGKHKYRSVYKHSAYEYHGGKATRITVNNCPVPRLVPYHKLMPFIKNIDIGKLYSVRETLCVGMKEEDQVNGVYRSLKELLLKLACYYLNQHMYKLIWFNGQTNKYFVSLGGDGAPFGKDDTACSWLVSFLNVGRGILSSNENFLLFGANCSENSVAVSRFIQSLMVEVSDIESSTYSVNVNGSPVDVQFHFAELPNDMKMLAFLAGELSNSAKYFSSFGNVSYDNANNISGTFVLEGNSTWDPWKYNERLKVAKKVKDLKKSLEKKKIAPSTKRTRVTAFIASKESRQEFPPPMGELIDRAHVEPLHLKNNACALAHRYLLNEVIKMSRIPDSVNCFSMIAINSPFYTYISTMRKCKLMRLSKKIVRWFDDTKALGKNFDYRFTGKDSKMFLHNFMFLISAVISSAESGRETVILHVLSYICLCLRDCVSIFNRLDISDNEVGKLKSLCSNYYRAHQLFFCSISPTVWHVGHVIPAHNEDMRRKYGMGLPLNSMEGREAKHISISKYSKNTMYQSRWEQVFLHEYVSLIWLRERGINLSKVSKGTLPYIPHRATKDPVYCYCGLQKQKETDDKCKFCSHILREKIQLSIDKGQNLFCELK